MTVARATTLVRLPYVLQTLVAVLILQKANCDHELPSYTCIKPGAVERTKPPDIFIQKEKNIAKRNKWANVRRLAQNW